MRYLLSFEAMHSSVLPVLRNLPTDHPRLPPLPGLKRQPVTPLPLLLMLMFIVGVAVFTWVESSKTPTTPPRVTSDGRVMQVERIGANLPANSQQTFIKYRFMVGNDLIYGSEIVRSEEIIPSVGDRIEISYMPASPQDNYRVAAEVVATPSDIFSRFALSAFITVFLLVWLSFVIFLFSPILPRDWLSWRRARALYRNGEIVTGRVQFVRPCSVVRVSNQTTNYEIVATYKVEGVRLLVTTRCNNGWLTHQLAPEVEVVVAYDPIKPERAVILEPFAF